MKLLNLSEHRSCFNYQLNFASGFTRYKLAAQECGQVDNDSCFCILFLLKGELLVDIGQEHHISLLRNRRTGLKVLYRQNVFYCFGTNR